MGAWLVTNNTPGYMPEGDGWVTSSWESARDALIEDIDRAGDAYYDSNDLYVETDPYQEAIEELKRLSPNTEWSTNLPSGASPEHDLGISYSLTETDEEPEDDDSFFASRKDNGMNLEERERTLLSAMAGERDYSKLTVLDGELQQVRAQRTAKRLEASDLEIGDAIVTSQMTPVRTHEHHTDATDWLGTVAAVEGDPMSFAITAAAEATYWFGQVSEAVKADDDEFGAQAQGASWRYASQFGEHAPAVQEAYLSHFAHLHRQAVGVIDASKTAVSDAEIAAKVHEYVKKGYEHDSATGQVAREHGKTQDAVTQIWDKHRHKYNASKTADTVPDEVPVGGTADSQDQTVEGETPGTQDNFAPFLDAFNTDVSAEDTSSMRAPNVTAAKAHCSIHGDYTSGRECPDCVAAREEKKESSRTAMNWDDPDYANYDKNKGVSPAPMGAPITGDHPVGPGEDEDTTTNKAGSKTDSEDAAFGETVRTLKRMHKNDPETLKRAWDAIHGRSASVEHTADTVKEDETQDGYGISSLPDVEVDDPNDKPMWPYELPDKVDGMVGAPGDPGDKGKDAADVGNTPTPGQSVADYPSTTLSPDTDLDEWPDQKSKDFKSTEPVT